MTIWQIHYDRMIARANTHFFNDEVPSAFYDFWKEWESLDQGEVNQALIERLGQLLERFGIDQS